MPYCPKCGEEIRDGKNFCPKCGAALSITVQEKKKGPDVLGLMSVGVIIILIALTYLRYPIESSEIAKYFESMADKKIFIKPPLIIFDAAFFFLCAVGLWGIILSGLRIVFQRSLRRALGDLIGGFFSFFYAFLLTNYAADIYTWQTTLAYFIIAIGLFIIINAIINFTRKDVG